MKKWLNGNIVDMTADELAELEAQQTEAPAPTPTIE